MTAARRPSDEPDDSTLSPEYICGYPTSRRDGGACQHPVAHPGGRCHHHPRTALETTNDVTDATEDPK